MMMWIAGKVVDGSIHWKQSGCGVQTTSVKFKFVKKPIKKKTELKKILFKDFKDMSKLEVIAKKKKKEIPF